MEIGTNVLHRAIMTQIVGDFSSALAQMVVTRICRIQPEADSREEIVE
jgi:poly(A) polymerase Pap1